mmetsp:Transcript_91570/g.182466  ORF Transcript_91570/g.182466 Transcript_91570/m.182466 type:complete len:253 (+) Transcript_91570:106-864(+)
MFRSRVLELLVSDDASADAKMKSMLEEAMKDPTMKLGGGTASKHHVVRAPIKPTPHGPSLSGKGSGTPRFSSVTPTSRPGSISLASSSSPPPMSSVAPKPLSQLEKNAAASPVNKQASVRCAVVAAAAGSESGTFCVCGAQDDNEDETFIKCTVGTGGCNGWVHLDPRCSGLSESQIDDIILLRKQPPNYMCHLCHALPTNRISVRAGDSTAQVPLGGKRPAQAPSVERHSSGAVPASRGALMKKLKQAGKR